MGHTKFVSKLKHKRNEQYMINLTFKRLEKQMSKKQSS